MHVLLFLLLMLMLAAVPWRGWHDYGLYPATALGVLTFMVLLFMLFE